MANLWEEMETATIGGGGNYLPSGFNGVVRIKRCHFHKGFEQDLAFIAEYEVIESNMPGIAVGASYSWYQGKLEDKKMRTTALGEIKGFIAAVIGIDPGNKSAVDAEVAPQLRTLIGNGLGDTEALITGTANGFEGECVHVETWNKVTRENKKDFTKHKFTPLKAAA